MAGGSLAGAQILGTSSLLWTLGSTWALQLHSHYLCKNHISGDITRVFFVIETRRKVFQENQFDRIVLKITVVHTVFQTSTKFDQNCQEKNRTFNIVRFTTTPCINQKQEDTLVMFYFFFSFCWLTTGVAEEHGTFFVSVTIGTLWKLLAGGFYEETK